MMQASHQNVAVIGAGNMAEAILHAVLAEHQLRAEQIIAADISEPRRRLFEQRFGVETTSDNQIAVQHADTVLLAVKPQTFRTVAAEIADLVTENHLFISIIAGVPTGLIENLLGGKTHVVRVMPNLPIQVGAGIAAVCKGQFATSEELAFVKRLFDAGGKAIIIDEGLIDAVTAVSGSGPAYFYYFVEAITAGGVAAGLRPDQALTLAEYACLGAAKMMIETKERPADLRRKVTSPGGTTQAAIEYMNSCDVAKNITAAILRAFDRAKELAQS